MYIELSEVQKSIYFECLTGEKFAYHISASLKVKELDANTLYCALNLLTSEQESLRSSVVIHENKPVLHVQESVPVNFHQIFVKNEADFEDEIQKATTFEFDFEKAPLYHVTLIKQETKSVLVVLMHHLISDGISVDIFIRKLLFYYHKLLASQPFPLQVNEGYHKFLEKEQKNLTSGKYSVQREYWKKELEGVQPLSLFSDYSFQQHGTGIGKEKRFPITEKLYHAIQETARNYEITEFMLLLGTFAVLMGKYSNTDDVVISSSFSHRPNLENETSIGCYIYTLPLRFDVQTSCQFRDIFKQSEQRVVQAYKNLGYPNNLIAHDACGGQVWSSSLFGITFICDTYQKQADEIEGIYEMDTVTFPGNMMVIMQKVGQEVCIKFQYKPHLYSDETIQFMGEHFITLLKQATQNPQMQLNETELFTPDEYENILHRWNDTDYFEYTPQNIADFFEKKVALYPDVVSLVSGDKRYTNQQINERANQLARKLIPMKTSENPLVGIQLERSPEMIIAILAVLKVGCGYVPIDTDYPDDRKNYIVDDADISVLITDSTLHFPAKQKVTRIDLDNADIFTGEATNPAVVRKPSDLAYVEYTSGSTGKPKGVMIQNESVINTVLDLDRRFPLEENDVYLLKTTYTFDIFGTEFYGWIVGKGVLCILEKDGEMKPEVILQTIAENHVTHINFVPSMFRVFLETLGNEPETLCKLSSVKWFFLGGEAVTQDVVQKFFSLGIEASLENLYGPTEATMWATHQHLHQTGNENNIAIGKPLNAYHCYVIDAAQKLCPVGIPGELCISGIGLARGYLNQKEMTSEKFIPNPFYSEETDSVFHSCMYRTGDLTRWKADGTLEFLGRIDSQVKINGIRIELGEIETILGKNAAITQAVAVIRKNDSGMEQIIAYYTAEHELPVQQLRGFLADKIPSYMMPTFFVYQEAMPLNNSGKIDRKLLTAKANEIRVIHSSKQVTNDIMETIMSAWREVLGFDGFGTDDNFFEIGGRSFALIQVHNILKEKIGGHLSINALLQYPTARKLSEYISLANRQESNVQTRLFSEPETSEQNHSAEIAVIGIAVDVPGATDVHAFWDVLKNGKETIHFYTDEELRNLGISEQFINSKNYVKAKGRVDDIEVFDSTFFDISPKETDMTSPSLRLLYKGTWHVLEDAGYVPDSFNGRIGVFLGGSDDFMWYQHALFHNMNYSDTYQAYTLSTNHFLATRLSYKFNFKGPALTALTGCSTSLVTTHLACRSLQAHECEIAIAGGVTVEMPNEGGYLYEAGMMFSPDGHCRPFDARANGTVFSNGMGLVALKRLEDALRDGDHIYAVIKGSALNNDGNNKLSYTAPSEEGQVEVIREAYNNAHILPETVRYVEAHGTGTLLGDPIEVGSLTKVFASDRKQFCTLGSLKGNIGHTDTAAGIVGLSKVSLCLDKKFLPATVNYQVPNPKVDFSQTPFIVKNYGEDWERSEDASDIPLRAGINSFGVGGTNAHFVLEEAPQVAYTAPDALYHVLAFSAKTETALHNTIQKVISYLQEQPEISLSDAAFTLRNGRKKFKYQKSIALTERMRSNAEQIIDKAVKKPVFKHDFSKKPIYLMFSGQGSQYQGMGRELYFGDTSEFVCRVFREEADKVFSCLSETQRKEYFDVLYGTENPEQIHQTKYTQFALFVTEYALAQVVLQLGVSVTGLLGHSIGEVTAAAIAGVWSLTDAVKIVLARGSLMQQQKPGSMLAIMADAEKIEPVLPSSLWLCLKNTSGRCVVGGSKEEIVLFSESLKKSGIGSVVIKTSHAFHTGMMQEAAEQFCELLRTITFHAPKYSIISNVTGDYAENDILTPEYWRDHIIHCVQFEQDLDVMFRSEQGISIEIGPGKTLTTFALQHKEKKENWILINLLRHVKEQENDIVYLYEKISVLDFAGITENLPQNFGQFGKRVSLPGYVFDALSYPISLENISEAINTDSISKSCHDAVQKVQVVIADMQTAEQYAMTAYKEVFGFENIDMQGDFFAMGGDSLKGVSMAGVLKNLLGINIEVNDIFSNPTPKSLAVYLFEHHSAVSQDEPNIGFAPEMEYYDISFAQRRIYTMYLMSPQSLAYNLPSATAITGGLEKEKVICAVEKMMQRHELLRSSFEMHDNRIVQVIHNDISKIPVTFTSRKISSEEDFQNIVKEFVRPFRMEEAPLFRIEIIDTGDKQQLLLFDVHHIIADGTSVEILTRDFNALYFGELEPLQLQYKDFAFWQQENQNSEKMQKQEKYWLGQLSGELPVLHLPTDYQRKEIPNLSGGRVKFDLSEKTIQAVQALGKKFGATNFMVMLSIWYVLLARYTNQEDIIIGTPVSGRTSEEIHETVGMFVNMLPLRNFPSSEKHFSDFLLEVKENVLEALQNQDYPFDTLVERIHVQRKLNRNAVFDVSFDYHNMQLYDLEVEGIKFKSQEIDNRTISLDLILTCFEDESKELTGCIDYSSELFKKDTIERMILHYQQLLVYFAENPECQIKDASMVSQTDLDLICRQFDTVQENLSVSVQELFEEKVREMGNVTALITSTGKTFTYAELNQEADCIAWQLRRNGVVENTYVGIMTERNEALIISILAVLKAGCAYIPLDASYPSERLSYMVQKSEMQCILCSETYLELAKKMDLSCVLCFEKLQEENMAAPLPEVNNADSIAYVIFTSGSTGMPKGVMVKQSNIVNLIKDHQERKLFAEPDDRIACLASPSFDIFVFETLLPLCSGGSVYLASREEQLDTVLLSEKMAQYQVNYLQAPVSRLRAMTENTQFKKLLPQFRVIVGGGEMYPEMLMQYLQNHTSARLFNMYGPTETTVTATVKELKDNTGTVNIGKPVANAQIVILDKNHKLLPVGIFGELCISGKGVSAGYINAPDETKKRFISFTLTENKHISLYCTGDMARMLSNGEIEIAGRIDNQVKIRGYRVELSEIEKVAMSLDTVSYAVASTCFDETGNTQIILFFSMTEITANVDSVRAELQDLLKKHLPHYMLPSRIIFTEEMPVLPNGKVDRNAFAHYNYDNYAETHIVSEQKTGGYTKIELEIQKIWKEILHLNSVSVKDNFFDVGGNSYSLMLVNNRLNDLLQRHISLMTLFEYPTIETLAKAVTGEEKQWQETVQTEETAYTETDIAVIGMSGRFPDADSVDEFWEHILQGKEAIVSFSEEELRKSGISETEYRDSNYVNAKGILRDVQYFDADFFHYSKKEASVMDPQMRILHMCVWNALEDAGYNPYQYSGKIGLFAGSSSNMAWMTKFMSKRNNALSTFEVMTMNDKDFLTTKISYKLNLKGPSVNVQTACSTSLVAIHEAIKALQCGETDIAIAGGVSITYPQKEGYLWHEGMIYSKDGHCRPFSDDSSGTVPGNGCAVVVLKKLSSAIKDRDNIYAIIKGSAVNNDGIEKIGYTAPSISGESDAIQRAMQQAKFTPENIQYIETHGTGTKLGDPIEIQALKQAWHTQKKNYCALGAVKANIGHLDAAAGVAGFIKTVQILKHRTIPPMINFRNMNQEIDINNSPFYVTTECKPLASEVVARAAVSAFGIGGTNAHVVLEEMLKKQGNSAEDEVNLLVFSARTQTALENTSNAVMSYLKQHNEVNLSDAAYTLQVGRGMFEYRQVVILKNGKQVVSETGLQKSQNSLPVWVLPFDFSDLTTDLYTNDSSLGLLFSQYAKQVLKELRFKEAKAVKQAFQTGETGEESIRNLAGFTILYSVMKIFQALGIIPSKIYAQGIGKLCADTFTGTLSLTEALQTVINWQADGQAKQQSCIPVVSEPCYEKEQVVQILSGQADAVSVYQILGKLWINGCPVRWEILHLSEERTRISLPGYVFDKTEFDSDVSWNQEEEEVPVQQLASDLSEKELSEIFAGIWQETLGVSYQNDEDDFFALGGESFNAVMMVSLIQQKMHVNILAADIMTLSQYGKILSHIMQNVSKIVSNTSYQEIRPLPEQEYYPTSSAQKRMYMINQLFKDSTAYNLGAVYRVEGTLQREKICSVIETLVMRHESFRTSFEIMNDEVVQRIHQTVPSAVSFAKSIPEQIEAELKQAVVPFDLSQAPLMRVKFISISETVHYMIIDIHHIIADQSSMAVLMQEFTMLYEGKQLPDKKLKYADFAVWQNELMKNGQMEKQLTYWKKEFEDDVPVLDFPTDYPKGNITSDQGKRQHFVLDKALCGDISQWLAKNHVTGYILMMTALDLLLWKYTSKKDFVIGTAFSGRRTQELNNIIGMFVNTLPVRVKIDDSVSTNEFLQYVRQKMLEALEAQDCQFEVLVNELGINQQNSENPLFDFIMNYVSIGTEEFEIADLKLTPCQSDDISAKYDFVITVIENDGNYQIEIEYRTCLFNDDSIALFGQRFINTVSQLVHNENQAVKDFTLMTETDWNQLENWNQTYREIPSHQSIASLFEICVQQFPSHPAIIWKEEQYTYEQLDYMSNYLAEQIAEAGVKQHDKVMLLLEEGIIQVAAILAVLKCGGVYVPVDCDYPAERIAYVMEDSSAALVITQKPYAETLPVGQKCLVIHPDELEKARNKPHFFQISEKLSGDDEVYIIYTSGSTGTPKGVVICGKSLIRTLINTNYYPISTEDRLIQMSSYTFDASVFSIFGALLNGASLVIVPKKTVLEIPKFAALIQQQQITKAFIVTAIFNVLVDYDASCLRSVKSIYIGGEALSFSHIKKALSVLKPGQLVNVYGPTEAAVISSYHVINQLDEKRKTVPIGKPISNTGLYIIDDYGNILPPNMIGELCIGGIGLAKEYLNNAKATAEKFIFLHEKPEQKVYRTGDLAMMTQNGDVIYLGRIDSQVKLRGYRIELGEIEQRLSSINGIKEAAVVTVQDDVNNMYIGGCYVSDKELLTPEYLKNILKRQLPQYMIPEKLLHLDSFPMTSSGKLDRKKLKELLKNSKQLSILPVPTVSAPETNKRGLETILQEMRAVLNQPTFGPEDDFFEHGGHSIKAISLVQRLLEKGIELMVYDVMNHHTAKELVSMQNSAELPEIPPKNRKIHVPEKQISAMVKRIDKKMTLLSETVTENSLQHEFSMTAVQKMHFKCQMAQSGFTIIVKQDDTRIRHILAELIIQHPLLHCTADKNREIWKEWDVQNQEAVIMQSIPFLDLAEYDAETSEKIVRQTFEQLMYQNYEEDALLWRMVCLRLSQNEMQVIWCFHHSAFDGMSAEILKRQLLKSAEMIDIPEKSVLSYEQYADLIEQGPVNITPEEMMQKTELLSWAGWNSKFCDSLKQNHGSAHDIKIIVPLQKMTQDIWSYAYCFIVKIMSQYCGLETIPVAIVNYGRKYGNQEFFNCVGEFLDIVPIVNSQNIQNMEQMLKERLEFFSQHHINILHLMYQQSGEFYRVAETLHQYLRSDNSLNMFLYNFQGYISAEERQLFEMPEHNDVSSSEGVLATLMAAVNYDDKNLKISLASSNGINSDKLKEIVCQNYPEAEYCEDKTLLKI